MNTSTTRNSPTSRRRAPFLGTLLVMGLTMLMGAHISLAQSPAPVDLQSAASFGVLGGSTVTSTGGTAINGDLGLSPGSAIDGFPPGTVTGSIFINTPEAVNGQADLTTAYNDAAGRSTNPITVAGNIGGQTLPPGLYKSQTSLDISSGDLTLDAQGDQNAVWIFQMASTLTTTSGRQVVLTNGALAANVFWQVGTSATIGTTSAFAGTILADQSITLETGATLNGRALARIGAVSLDGNSVTVPTAAPPPPPPSAGVTITLPDTEADVNVPISISVTTNDIDGKGVRSYDFTVTYDAAVITLDSVSTMGTLSEDAVVTVNPALGSISINGVNATDFSGSGVLVNLTGTSSDAGNSDLTFSNVMMNSGVPDGTGVDGSIVVASPPPPPVSEDVTLTLPITGTEPQSSIELPVLTSDIAGKGVLSYDFTVTYDAAVITLDSVSTAGTLSEDAVVTVNPALGSIQVVGVRATDFAGSGVLVYLTGTSGNTGQSDLLFDSVTFNSGAPDGIGVDGSIQVSTAPPVQPVTLTLPVTGAEPGVQISLPVLTGSIADKGVLSYDFTVTYDPAVITLDSVDTAGTLSEDASVTVDTTGGSIHVVGFRGADFAGSGVLIYLTGMASDSGTSDLTFTSVTLNNGTPEGIGVDGNIQITVGVANEGEDVLPGALVLRGNYPNPFQASTMISFDLPHSADVSVQVFDMLGRQVMALPSATLEAGADRRVRVDGTSLSSGIYLYRVTATSTSGGTHVSSGRMSLIK